ncbi:MAG: 50S ribosomal protein L11 methyltransferase, partial [Desulfococcaceae bacterium]
MAGDGAVPFGVGGLFVAPPWSDAATPPGTRRIHLDPGVVFGTGTHPTTRECLAALQEVCARDRIGRATDLGTGTGVLALAAAALGAGPVLAVDLNRLAVETARRNIVRNRMADRVLAVQGRAESLVEAGADLLMANLHHEAMTQV